MLTSRKIDHAPQHPPADLYAVLMARVRAPIFYTEKGVPDTFDGRFDLLLLHLFLVMERLLQEEGGDYADFNQALFDVVFADMDQTLRERGIGDMGVPKHMRRMMTAFNGRMHAYHTAFGVGEDQDITDALRRNLFGTVNDVAPQHLQSMLDYAKTMRALLRDSPPVSVMSGDFLVAYF